MNPLIRTTQMDQSRKLRFQALDVDYIMALEDGDIAGTERISIRPSGQTTVHNQEVPLDRRCNWTASQRNELREPIAL